LDPWLIALIVSGGIFLIVTGAAIAHLTLAARAALKEPPQWWKHVPQPIVVAPPPPPANSWMLPIWTV